MHGTSSKRRARECFVAREDPSRFFPVRLTATEDGGLQRPGIGAFPGDCERLTPACPLRLYGRARGLVTSRHALTRRGDSTWGRTRPTRRGTSHRSPGVKI